MSQRSWICFASLLFLCPSEGQTAVGTVSTLAGSNGATGSANGIGTAATFNRPAGVAIAGATAIVVSGKIGMVLFRCDHPCTLARCREITITSWLDASI